MKLNEPIYSWRWDHVTQDFVLMKEIELGVPAGYSMQRLCIPLEVARELIVELQERIDIMDFCPGD